MTGSEDAPVVSSAIRNQQWLCFNAFVSCSWLSSLFPRILIDVAPQIAGTDFMLPKAVFFGVVPIIGASGGPMTAEFADAMHEELIVETSIPLLRRSCRTSLPHHPT